MLAYYFVATFLPIDKVVGKLYPIFGICLIIMAIGLSGSMLFSGKYEMSELWNSFSNNHPQGLSVWPFMFISVACGAISGFHATQTSMMARCVQSEQVGRKVFNGDIGQILSVNMQDRTLVASFDGRSIEYDVSELDELVHAYATTIHKAQGSEYPIVVMPVLMNHYIMLQRNLIYTGITRAKKTLVIVGQKKALAYAVRNLTVTERNTMLKDRLMGYAARLAGLKNTIEVPEIVSG